jgi:hypothetical protein
MKILVTGLVFFVSFAIAGTAINSTRSKNSNHYILLLGLDGISYQTAIKMHENGMFREFQRPIPMVATFPSISDPNWAHLVNAPIEKGFTKAGFDIEKNQEYGNLIDHLTAPPQYEKKFDFKAEGVFEHLMSMTWTETSALFWTDSLLRYLLEPKNIKDKKITKAFIVNTDIISHVGGEKNVTQYLKALDSKIKKLQSDFKKEYSKNLEIVIVSDHGNHFQTPKSIDYKTALEKHGFFHKPTLEKSGKEKTDYTFVAPEIISFGAFYTLPGSEQKLAQSFTDISGVHVALAVGDKKNSILVYSKKGSTEITIDPKNKKVSYKLISGMDPFDQIELFKSKTNLNFDEYFYKTLNSPYPNALVRAWEGFYKNSQIKPSVLVSAELGYVFTNLTLKILTAMSGVQSTHGSFHREESLGVVMSTLPLSEEAITSFDFEKLLVNDLN